MATLGGWDQLVVLDRKAAELARGVGQTTLLLGECLSALGEREGHHALGFSSLGAYVQERCGRTARWGRDVARLARGVSEWPELRRAILRGEVTWSAAEVVLRALAPWSEARAALDAAVVAAAENDWVGKARSLTVRELRGAVAEARSAGTAAAGTAVEEAVHPYLRRLPTHVLTLMVSTENAWWFECARRVYERSVSDCSGSVRSNENFLLALLAEARVELEAKDRGTDATVLRWGAYVEQLAEWREESERRCDQQRRGLQRVEVGTEDTAEGAASGESALELDARVCALAADLLRRDLELGRLATWLQRAEAWRRLGFANEAHYVRERMGVSFSQWKLWRHVARRLGAYPRLESAVERGELGFETAALLMRVVASARAQSSDESSMAESSMAESLWLERARRRTFKHLREEVHAAELAAQQTGRAALPPSEEMVQRLRALEGRVKSGAVLLEPAAAPEAEESRLSVAADEGHPSDARKQSRLSVAGRAWLDLRGELCEILGGAFLGDLGVDTAAREPSLGRRGSLRRGAVRLRLRLERDTLVEFRCLERLYGRQHGGEFLEFLCRHFLAVWAPAMLSDAKYGDVKYGDVYRRDSFTCSSPVCERHDVQPHHLRFRSAGGGEERENLTALCTWCHLEGVHGGRLRVQPPASRMHWQIGPGLLEVFGRELVR